MSAVYEGLAAAFFARISSALARLASQDNDTSLQVNNFNHARMRTSPRRATGSRTVRLMVAVCSVELYLIPEGIDESKPWPRPIRFMMNTEKRQYLARVVGPFFDLSNETWPVGMRLVFLYIVYIICYEQAIAMNKLLRGIYQSDAFFESQECGVVRWLLHVIHVITYAMYIW